MQLQSDWRLSFLWLPQRLMLLAIGPFQVSSGLWAQSLLQVVCQLLLSRVLNCRSDPPCLLYTGRFQASTELTYKGCLYNGATMGYTPSPTFLMPQVGLLLASDGLGVCTHCCLLDRHVRSFIYRRCVFISW